MAHLSLSEWLARAESDRRFRENTTSITHIPASEGNFALSSAGWTPATEGPHRAGHPKLYSHQARAIELVHQGKDVVLVTPTASGKTLCYNIPVLQKIIEEPRPGPFTSSHKGPGQ